MLTLHETISNSFDTRRICILCTSRNRGGYETSDLCEENTAQGINSTEMDRLNMESRVVF